MFSIGFQEIAFILLLALIIFGPKKLPETVKYLGENYRKLKSEFDKVSDQLRFENLIKDTDAKKLRDELEDD